MKTLWIGGNPERTILNKILFLIAVFDYQNTYYDNGKLKKCVRPLSFWQPKTLYLAVENNICVNEKSFAIAAYPVWITKAQISCAVNA